MSEATLDKIVSLCKRRGFVFRGAEIYGGLSGTWDYGPLGAELAYNIKDLWWEHFVRSRDDMYGISSSTILPEKVWETSGHLENFTDPLVECGTCHRRFRADHLKNTKACLECGGSLGSEQSFNTMFPVKMGAGGAETTTAYLRGELAQGMFVNFKNILDTFHPRIPFGIAQIGRAYRNEISPRDFIYRVREFEIAEFEYFIGEPDWERQFEYWRKEMCEWLDKLGIDRAHIKENDLPQEERAHYSKRTIDFEYQSPIGDMEIQAIAYRTNYDLTKHMEASGVDMRYTNPETGERFVPHVIEPTFGVGRVFLAILFSAYTEDDLGGEKRAYLKLKPALAPVKVAVFPLLRNKPELVEKARSVRKLLVAGSGLSLAAIAWDDNGNIGKRYRRQDEVGTPFCVTVDFQTLDDNTVTVRDRDTGEQVRISTNELTQHLKKRILK